ncbi:MAG: diguanylate cyclase, partial [Deltaproteobacteria bacterium]|nr:diguanylate cyclase [Deltaproteobacteria bacterium]
QRLEPEHLLLALIDQEEGLVGQLLEKVGVGASRLSNELEASLAKVPAVSGGDSLHLSNRLNRLLLQAEDEAKRLTDEYISTEHLLLASFKDDELGALSRNFNQMLSHITALTATKIQTEQDLLFAQRELKLKTKLAEQNKVIEKNNQMLEAIVRDLSLLYEIGQGVNSTIELEELYRVITDVFQQRLKLDKFAILIKDESNSILQVKAAYGFDDTDHIMDMTFRIGEGVTGEVVIKGEPVYIKDTTKEERFLHYKGERVLEGSFLSVPLVFKKDTLGVINFHRPNVDSFSEEEIRLLKLVANQVALAIENAKLYTARDLSIKDELTGLYNRRHFQTVLQIEWKRAVRFHRSLSLLMIDADHFKKYNDTFGHLQGDKVLREMANLLRKNVREIDTVARFGGEEFIILLPDTDKKGSVAVGEKLRKIIEAYRFIDTSGTTVSPITISVGIASYPDDVRELDDLIDHADIALYDAKDAGRNRVVCYPQLTLPTSLDAARNLKRPTLVS